MSEKVLRGSIGVGAALQGVVSSRSTLTGNVAGKGSLLGAVSNPEKIYGKSAYEIAVKNGFEGTEEEWLESLKGEPGKTPVKGEDYFTEADKKELVNDVIAKIPFAEDVRV